MDRALIRSRAVFSSAHDHALSMKKAGTINSFLDMGPSYGLAQISAFQDQGANQQRYLLFRGWVHAAVNALATQAAGQPVHVGKMKGTKGKPKDKKEFFETIFRENQTYLAKAHHIAKMPECLRTKAAKNELEVFNDHPLLSALEKPNPIQYGWQFTYSFIANLCLTGWAFIVGGRNEEGEPEFYSLPTTWVHPDHAKGAFAEFRIINPRNPSSSQGQAPLTRDQVAFAYLPNPSDPM